MPSNTTVDRIISQFPEEVQVVIRTTWQTLSPGDKTNLLALIGSLPSDTNLMRLLIRLGTVQLRQSFGQKHRVAIVGPANVGKSTLFNQLIESRRDQAAVGPLPGTTRLSQKADAGLFAIIDTPGADAVGEVGENERVLAFGSAENSDFLIIVFDAIQGIKKNEQELFRDLTALGKPFIVLLNKIDLVGKEKIRVQALAAANLHLKPEQVIPVVAKDGTNLNQVIMAISVAEPGIVTALGRALPQYRWQMAWRAIVSAASISAVIALTPLPIIDFAPLLVTQSIMVLGIARIYNYSITVKRARELIVTFGLGFLGRTLFQELSKLGGIPGWLLSAAIASSTTVVMGYAAASWFNNGERLSADSIRTISGQVTRHLLDSLRSLGGRRPTRETLQQIITESLDNYPRPEDIPSPERKKTK